ncbi:conserved hypothetical protein [Ricinus communis]|uniref:Uncharacterized protein n=1 Tax=Ricinus communis TaxID=3988 RepID=B9S1C6_RICCO|nr:conserved hypothetical protein [Ricinus communis]
MLVYMIMLVEKNMMIMSLMMQKLTSSVDIPSNMVPVDEKSSYKTIQGEDIWDQREESAEEKTKKPSQAAAGSTKKLQKKPSQVAESFSQ